MPELKTGTGSSRSGNPPGDPENPAALGVACSTAEAFARCGLSSPPWTVAAPSFVIPGTARENCAWLRKFFPEVALLLFETRACLDYGPDDLPRPGEFPELSYHVHLPLDLGWERGFEAVWADLAGLLAKVAGLAPWAYVLHPPPPSVSLERLARAFADAGISPGDVLLENTRERCLSEVWEEAVGEGFSACLDLGHLLAYGQDAIPDLPGFWHRARLLHLCAPGLGGRHESLARLDAPGRETLRRLLARFAPGGTLLLELFDAPKLQDSLDFLAHCAGLWSRTE
ncbi:cobamide remodeling phosphodiesterase CbiR [Desulfovibrio aminophilus]|uniref:cobamide remodeling phosphodiesterase CbiR n=1 Tax=Desulfovibrio aminophilus TaxID=81425 RepID=UPI0033917B8A